jgi:hypothetical protein
MINFLISATYSGGFQARQEAFVGGPFAWFEPGAGKYYLSLQLIFDWV